MNRRLVLQDGIMAGELAAGEAGRTRIVFSIPSSSVVCCVGEDGGKALAPQTGVARRSSYCGGDFEELEVQTGGKRERRSLRELPDVDVCQTTLLSPRVDAFYLGFQGGVREMARVALNEGVVQAGILRTAIAMQFGPLTAALNAQSREGWWVLENEDVRVVLMDGTMAGPRRGWNLEVRATALFLMRKGPHAALAMGRQIAVELLELQGERLRRLDLSADFVGFGLGEVSPSSWVSHSRCRAQEMSLLTRHFRMGKRTGFSIGKSAVVARIYDKTEELSLSRNDGAKRHEEMTGWRMAGWDGKADVTRVEFELRTAALKELGAQNPEVALSRLDGMWAYCSKKWLRLVDLTTATRRDRCANDARWDAVQAVVFQRAAEPLRRERAPARARATLATSAAINCAAQSGQLRLPELPDGVMEWSDARAQAWVQLCFSFMFDNVERIAAEELVKVHGGPGAVLHLHAKMKAALARFAAFEMLGEVVPIERLAA